MHIVEQLYPSVFTSEWTNLDLFIMRDGRARIVVLYACFASLIYIERLSTKQYVDIYLTYTRACGSYIEMCLCINGYIFSRICSCNPYIKYIGRNNRYVTTLTLNSIDIDKNEKS